MPEGPTIVIFKDEVQQFTGMQVLSVSGNSKIDQQRLPGKTVVAFKSWGKHFLICFEDFSLRIHFLLFGSYRVNERKETTPRLSLEFENGEINLYACSVKFIEGAIDDMYDFTSDVMDPEWNPSAAKDKLMAHPNMMVCDSLLEQDFFAGVGNIIKNEVLYRIRVHPESQNGSLPDQKIDELIAEARNYSFDFLEWKKKYELKKHWLAHAKKTCVRCDIPLIKKITGVKKRRSFFCPNCQIQYDENH